MRPSGSRRRLGTRLSRNVAPHEVLVDAPPAELEVDFDIEVFFPKQSVYRRLGDVSPVVRTLAQEQFDDYVKRVRIFVHPRIAAEARSGCPIWRSGWPRRARQRLNLSRERARRQVEMAGAVVCTGVRAAACRNQPGLDDRPLALRLRTR